jgi:hypothetical protein
VHILSLPQLQNRLRVRRFWLWSYFTGQRSSRLNSTRAARHDGNARELGLEVAFHCF